MINNISLLSKKRERSKSNTKSISHHNNKEELVTEINGFSVIELFYTESLENNNFQEENEMISLNESNNEKRQLKQNNLTTKEILTRTKLKDIIF